MFVLVNIFEVLLIEILELNSIGGPLIRGLIISLNLQNLLIFLYQTIIVWTYLSNNFITFIAKNKLGLGSDSIMVGYPRGNITIDFDDLNWMSLNKLFDMLISENTGRVPCCPKIQKIDWKLLNKEILIKKIQIFKVLNSRKSHLHPKCYLHDIWS